MLPDGRAAYDGRANAAENWFERSGLAQPTGDRRLEPVGGDAGGRRPLPRRRCRCPDGGYRIYYEARLPDESHELRTELIGGT